MSTDSNLMEDIGDVCEIRGEVTFEWQVKDFSSLSEKNKCYTSSKFYFCGASWLLKLCPNGTPEQEGTDGWIGVFLIKTSSDTSVTLDYSLGLKTIDKKLDSEVDITYVFERKLFGRGTHKLIQRSILFEKKSNLLLPSDTLTVVCTMKNGHSTHVTGSLFRRHQEICDHLKDIYENGKRTDCILKVNGANIAAHRMILETRSPVFTAMFRHDTKEKRTGEISIIDVEKCGMEGILEYIYSGDIKKLETETVLSIYVAAEKYDIKNVKEMCLDFVMKNLSTEWVLDVIKFAELYDETEIGHCARNYFRKNARRILRTEKWKTFARENHNISIELLGTVVEALLPE